LLLTARSTDEWAGLVVPSARIPDEVEGMRKPKELKKFEDMLTRVLAVPKEEIDRRDAEYRKTRKWKKPNSKPAL